MRFLCGVTGLRLPDKDEELWIHWRECLYILTDVGTLGSPRKNWNVPLSFRPVDNNWWVDGCNTRWCKEHKQEHIQQRLQPLVLRNQEPLEEQFFREPRTFRRFRNFQAADSSTTFLSSVSTSSPAHSEEAFLKTSQLHMETNLRDEKSSSEEDADKEKEPSRARYYMYLSNNCKRLQLQTSCFTVGGQWSPGVHCFQRTRPSRDSLIRDSRSSSGISSTHTKLLDR